MLTGYIGTYNGSDTKGIYQFNFEESNGKLSNISAYYSADDAKCAILNQDKLAITLQKKNHSGVALLNTKNGQLIDEILLENKTPCFIKYSSDFIYTANYHDGVVMIYQVKDNKLSVIKRIDIMPKAGCHQVILYQHYLVIPCLLIDEIRIFDTDNNFELVKIIKFPQKTGPRHGIFSKDLKHFYLVSELSNEFFTFDVEPVKLTFNLTHKISLLQKDVDKNIRQNSSTAAIRITKNEKYIYISTRGADLLTVIKLDKTPEIIQQIHDDISHPRDFLLSSNEEYILIVNRDNNSLISFKIDKNTGKINHLINKLSVPKGVGITLENSFL